jgi:hypothetical protein
MTSFALLTDPLGAQDATGMPVMVLGFQTGFDRGASALLVDDEGRLRWHAIEHIQIDWRYDWDNHQWVEVNGVTNAPQDDAPDGRPSVPR